MLEILGGVFKLEKSLKTNFKQGLSGDEKDLAERVALYGRNQVRLKSQCEIFRF